jgi:signal transduction histidine kinase
MKSGFVTVASHEFRTPLSTILSSAYLLEKYNEQHPDPKVEKHLHRIKSAVSGMKHILEDFLSVGKLEEGLMKPKGPVSTTSSRN